MAQREVDFAAYRREHDATFTAYPSATKPTMGVGDFVRAFDAVVEPGARGLPGVDEAAEEVITLTGRLAAKRDASKKLVFYTLESTDGAGADAVPVTLQLMSTLKHFRYVAPRRPLVCVCTACACVATPFSLQCVSCACSFTHTLSHTH
jgi:hypothetical protein